MKYDVEYDSYKLSPKDASAILNSLYFYHQHSPVLDDDSRDYIQSLINFLEKTKSVSNEQPS